MRVLVVYLLSPEAVFTAASVARVATITRTARASPTGAAVHKIRDADHFRRCFSAKVSDLANFPLSSGGAGKITILGVARAITLSISSIFRWQTETTIFLVMPSLEMKPFYRINLGSSKFQSNQFGSESNAIISNMMRWGLSERMLSVSGRRIILLRHLKRQKWINKFRIGFDLSWVMPVHVNK